MNIYGPNIGRTVLCNRLLSGSFHRMDRFILGGDLNFSIGEAETWGPNAIKDPLSELFLRLLDEKCIQRKTSSIKIALGNDNDMAKVIPLSDLALVE